MVIYRHTQIGTLTLWSLGIPAALLALSFAAGGGNSLAALGVLAVFLLCMLLFHSLTTLVSTDAVSVAFGPGWIRHTIPVRVIRAARAVRNPWWYGWGIRLTLRGWLWNVSGLDAVELELTDGSRFRIGTDEPARLVQAIEQAARLAR
jgi:hypothetical protein